MMSHLFGTRKGFRSGVARRYILRSQMHAIGLDGQRDVRARVDQQPSFQFRILHPQSALLLSGFVNAIQVLMQEPPFW